MADHATVAEVARELGVSETSFHRWPRSTAVVHARRVLGVSEARACRFLAQSNSVQHYPPKRVQCDRALVRPNAGLRRCHLGYGYRQLWDAAQARRLASERQARPPALAGKGFRVRWRHRKRAGWARARTASSADVPSTRTTSGATASRWVRRRTAQIDICPAGTCAFAAGRRRPAYPPRRAHPSTPHPVFTSQFIARATATGIL